MLCTKIKNGYAAMFGLTFIMKKNALNIPTVGTVLNLVLEFSVACYVVNQKKEMAMNSQKLIIPFRILAAKGHKPLILFTIAGVRYVHITEIY